MMQASSLCLIFTKEKKEKKKKREEKKATLPENVAFVLPEVFVKRVYFFILCVCVCFVVGYFLRFCF